MEDRKRPSERPTRPEAIGICIRSLNSRLITPVEYASCYHAWGGSFIIHPEVLQFCEKSYGIRTDYRGYFSQGKCIGAIATWGKYLAGDRHALRAYKVTNHVDFGYPVLYLPVAPGQRCIVLYRASFLLNLQQGSVRGGVFTGVKAMSILKQIPDELPTGKKEYQIKERRFARLGGTVRDVREFSTDEIAAIYEELFLIRWQRKPCGVERMKHTLSFLGKFLFGKVLMLKSRPVAIQINFRSETSRTICIDYINGGVDKSFDAISPGSLLSYLNGRDAWSEANTRGKQLIYSYGKSNTKYKDQWCHRIGRGFTGFWIP